MLGLFSVLKWLVHVPSGCGKIEMAIANSVISSLEGSKAAIGLVVSTLKIDLRCEI